MSAAERRSPVTHCARRSVRAGQGVPAGRGGHDPPGPAVGRVGVALSVRRGTLVLMNERDMPHRCDWAEGSDAMRAYHDDEWGCPSRDDRYLFEMLILEGAQAGLSWATILGKREDYRRALDGFDPERI